MQVKHVCTKKGAEYKQRSWRAGGTKQRRKEEEKGDKQKGGREANAMEERTNGNGR